VSAHGGGRAATGDLAVSRAQVSAFVYLQPVVWCRRVLKPELDLQLLLNPCASHSWDQAQQVPAKWLTKQATWQLCRLQVIAIKELFQHSTLTTGMFTPVLMNHVQVACQVPSLTL
jgi:hypothetical protein